MRSTATSCPRAAPSRPTSSATSGPRPGTTSIPCSRPKDADPGYDLTAILKQRKTEPLQMVRYGEGFFKSLGFAPLPKTFWERSMFIRPRDRDVICHASRLGPRQRRGSAPQDVHRHRRRGLLHRPPRARPQLLPARLRPPAVPVPQLRQRRLPRGHRRHHRPLHHPRLPRPAGLHQAGPRRIEGHRPAAEEGPRQDRLPALRPVDRPVALEGLLWPDSAREVQPGVVGAAR